MDFQISVDSTEPSNRLGRLLGLSPGLSVDALPGAVPILSKIGSKRGLPTRDHAAALLSHETPDDAGAWVVTGVSSCAHLRLSNLCAVSFLLRRATRTDSSGSPRR